MNQEIILLVGVFFAGLILGLIFMFIFNKLSTGSATAGQVKREMEDYQGQVESHFEETSKKFKQMTDQYQDLYQHLSVGATSLCRPENIAPGLVDQSEPNTKALPKEAKSEGKTEGKKAEKVVKDAAEKSQKQPEAPKKTNSEPKAAKTEAKTPTKDAKASGAEKSAKSKGNYNKNKNKK